MRKILVDANMLIGAFDGEPDNAEHEKARRTVKSWLSDPDVQLVITPLIRYEVLRGVRRVPMATMEEALNDFQELDVRAAQARKAAEVFRFAKQRGVPLDKRSFDLFHCACAETYGLEIASQDAHIAQIKHLIQDSQQNA